MKIIPLSSVIVEKRQRREIDSKALSELEGSILSNVGLLHPPVMWPRDDKWVLTVGERRVRAIQNIAKAGKSFTHAGQEVKPGEIPITPLGEYVTEVTRFEAELDENLRREELPWPDRCQALADLHQMRLAQNPKQTLTETGKEVAEAAGYGERRGRMEVTDAVVIAQHLSDPTIASARNANEALALIYKKEEEKVNAELIKRKLLKMTQAPTLEVKHGDLATVLPLLTSQSYDLILADPPYGIDAGSGGFRARTVYHHNYEDSPEVARATAECILSEGFRVTKLRANVFMFGAIEYFDWWKRIASNIGWVPFSRPLIWVKSDSEGLAPWGAQGPRITTEYIFYATKGQRGLVASPTDVFRVNRVPRAERLHAAEKPVELLQKLIECATLPGESVLDPCCGSGSTLVACRDSKRIGLGIEKKLEYYNTALSNVHGAPDAKA